MSSVDGENRIWRACHFNTTKVKNACLQKQWHRLFDKFVGHIFLCSSKLASAYFAHYMFCLYALNMKLKLKTKSMSLPPCQVPSKQSSKSSKADWSDWDSGKQIRTVHQHSSSTVFLHSQFLILLAFLNSPILPWLVFPGIAGEQPRADLCGAFAWPWWWS